MLHPLHDYEIRTIKIDHEAARIEIACGLTGHPEKTIVFWNVLSHLFLNTIMECIVFNVEEIPLPSFLRDYTREIDLHQNYGWPFNFRFPALPPDAGELPDSYRIWEISSSLGMFGCVIAKHAEVLIIT